MTGCVKASEKNRRSRNVNGTKHIDKEIQREKGRTNEMDQNVRRKGWKKEERKNRYIGKKEYKRRKKERKK